MTYPSLTSAYEEAVRRSIGTIYSNYGVPLSFRVDTAGTATGGTPKMSSISTTPADAIADLVRQLGKDADLSSVKNAFDNLEAEKRGRIGKALDGIVEMAVLEKPKMRRFVLAYWLNDESHIVDGIAYEGAEDSDADENHEVKVQLQSTDDYRIHDKYYSMAALCKRLDEQKIPYRIKYID